MGGGLFGGPQTVPTQQQQSTNQVFNQTGNQATTATQATTANPFALDLANQFNSYLYTPNTATTGGIHGGGGIQGMDLFQPFFGGWQEAAGKQIMGLNNVINPYAQTNIPAWMTQGADYMNQGAGIINQAPGLINQGAGFITQSGQPITGEDVSGFYNPMAGNVTAQLQNIFGQQNLANRLGSTASAGGTGADRAAVAQGLLANQQGLSAGQTYADLYQRALTAAQQQKAQQLQSGQGLVGAGGAMGGVGAGLAGVGQALGNQGLATGQLALASDAAAKEQAEAQAFHGLRQMQMLASALPGFIGLGQTGAATQATQNNLAGTQAGTGTGLSSTTYPAPPLLPQIAGLGATGLGLAGLAKGSDPRAKTDIQKYGRDPETGLPLYAFRYKGDPKSYPKVVGPMATDVKKKYPGAVVELGKDEYQDGGYVDGVSDNYSDDNSDYSSDDNQQSSAEADRAAKQRLARAQQAMKLLATTKVFQPKYQPTRSAGIKMPPTPWQMGRFAAGGAVPGMGMASPGSPNRGIYPQALNYGSLLAAQQPSTYPARPMYSSPMMAGAMTGRFGLPTGRGYAPIRQEGGRVDRDTAAAWGPEEYEVDPRPPDMRGPRDRTGYAMRQYRPPAGRYPMYDWQQIMRSNNPHLYMKPEEAPGIYADGGAVMQSPPNTVSGVQSQPAQQAAAPAAPMPQPDANQQQSALPTAAAPAIGGILPPTPAAAANPAQLLSALSIGMLMGSASSNRMRGRGFQKGGRIRHYQDGGEVGGSNANPWGLPPLDMMPPMPRSRPLPGMQPLTEDMPHFAGPAGIYEDAPERVPAPNAGRSGDFEGDESAAFTPTGGGRRGVGGAPTGGGGGFMGRDASMALMQAGLGMLAASGRRDSRGLPMSGLAAIGEGAGKGVSVYQQRQDEAVRQGRLQRAQAISEQNTLDLIRHRKLMETRDEVRPIKMTDEFGKQYLVNPRTGERIGPAEEVAAASPERAATFEPKTEEQKASAVMAEATGTSIKTPLTPRARQIIEQYGITPEQFDHSAVRYAKGDRELAKGFGGGKLGATMRQLMIARGSQYYIDMGMNEDQANATIAEFGAMKAGARTLGQQEARITGALEKAASVAPVVKDLSSQIKRTDYPALNKILMAAKEQTGDPTVIKYGIAIETLITEYGSALGQGNSVLTDHQSKRAESILKKAYSEGQMDAAVDQLLVEIDRVKAGVKKGMGTYLGKSTPAENTPFAPVPVEGGGGGGPQIGARKSFSDGKGGTVWGRWNGNAWVPE